MAKKTTAKTKAQDGRQVLIAQMNGSWYVVQVPGPDGSECKIGGALYSQAAAELCRDEIIQDLANGTYEDGGYPAPAFELWARVQDILKEEKVPNARNVARRVAVALHQRHPDPDSEIPF